MTCWAWLLSFAGAGGLAPGAYALEVDIVTESKLPVVGTKQVHTVSATLAQIRDDGGSLVQEQTTCEVRVDGGGPARTTIPPAFVKALPTQRIPVVLEGSAYRLDGGPVTLGADPARALPTEPDDPAVRDPDGDGHPGVTVWVDAPIVGRVEMYVVQRAHSVLEGALGDEGVEGEVVVRQMEQHTLAASNSLLSISPRVRPVEGASRFRLQPIERADCDAVRAAVFD